MNRIVITGGNAGMGLECVKLFLEQGDKVLFTSRTSQKAHAVLAALPEATARGDLFFCQCDSSKPEDVEKLEAYTRKTMGGCDVLINCAAIFLGGQVHEVSVEDYDLLMDIDVKGVFLTCRAFLPMMLAQEKGNLINISSSCGVRGGYNCAVYAAAKAAVDNLTRCMALDYGKRGIRANSVRPSATQTEMFLGGSTQEIIDAFCVQNPMGRIGRPEEVAKLIRFLASEDSSYINGQCLSIDGGLTCWNGEVRQDKTQTRK